MSKNEAFDIHQDAGEGQNKAQKNLNLNNNIIELLVDRDTMRELYAHHGNRQEILTNLGGYFEQPEKGKLSKQLKDACKSTDSELDDKKLFVSLYNSKLTLRELVESHLLARKEMNDYSPLWQVVLPLLEEEISHALETENSEKSYHDIIGSMSKGFLHRRNGNKGIKSLKDLLFETEFFCQHMGLDYNTILDQVELPFGKVMNGLANKSRKTKGIVTQMEPLLGAQLETKIIDKILTYGKQLQAYEQGVYAGDISSLVGLIDKGFLDEQLSGLKRSDFVTFLVSLYTSTKAKVDLPGPADSKLHLAIAGRSLGSKATERVMKQQSEGDWDQTVPLAYIDIDVHQSSPEVAVLLATYFPDKFESNNGTPQEGTVRLENRELIELTDIYLTCANLEAQENANRQSIEEKDISDDIERVFQEMQDRQQGSGEIDQAYIAEDDHIEDNHDDEMSGGYAVSDSEDDHATQQKGAHYAFGGYTDKVPTKLEAELKKEMGANYPKHGPYAWIEQGKIFYNTKWIQEKFGIEITDNPDRSMVAVSPLYAYLYNGKTLDDPDLDTGAEVFRAFEAWKKEQKRHEVLHRILGFNDITDIRVKTIEGEEVTLTQEQLCQLVEGAPGSRQKQLTINGKVFQLQDIEDAIAHALGRDNFSFDQVEQIDLDALEDYITHGDEAFLNQLDANAGAERKINKNEIADEAALNTVLTDHATNASHTTPSGRERISQSIPLVIGPHKFFHRKRRDTATGADVSERIEKIPNPEDKKNPYVRTVTSTEMAEELTKLNEGTYDSDTTPQPGPSETGGRTGNKKKKENNSDQPEKEEDDFKTQFESTIEGDNNAPFKKGTLLYAKVGESELPGYGGVWLQTQITDINEETNTYNLEVLGSTEKAVGNDKGRKISFAMSKKGLKDLTQRGELRKFSPITSGKEFYEYITQGLNSDDKSIKSSKQSRAGQQIKREEGKMLQKKHYDNSSPKFDPITHIGKIDKANMKNTLLYEVKRNGDTVSVSHEKPSRTKEMDYNTFLMFIADKGLAPFSDEQVKAAKQEKETHQDSQRPAVSRGTLGALGMAFKNLGPLFKNAFNFEERKKIQAARLTYSMSKLFGGGVALEALTSLDETIFSTISKFQSSLGGRESKDANDVQAEAVSRRIQREIFGNSIILDSNMFKLKAAGYLLYALDKGGHPYFRALNANAHQGLRVKAILGEKHHGVFMRERQKFIDEIKSGPENQVLFDKLIKFELNYIHTTVDKEEMVHVFGSQFGKKVEGFKDKFGAGDAIDNIKSSMANKNNFDDYATTFRGTLVKHTPATAIAALELMVESALTPAQYSEVYQSVVQLFVSGLGTWSFGQDHKDRLKKIGRMAGIPIALMADDVNAPHKVLTIVDHIASSAGIESLRSVVGNRDSISGANLTANGGHKKSMEAIVKRWGTNKNGQTVIDAFNYKNNHLLSYEETASGETKDIIDEYFNKRVFDELTDSRFGHSEKLTLGGDSPFYSNGILNISPATFNKVMLSVDTQTGKFREPAAREMRIEFKSVMKIMDSEISASKGKGKDFLLKLLLRKFALYIGSEFSSSQLKEIQQGLVNGKNMQKVEDWIRYRFRGDPTWQNQKDFDKEGNVIYKDRKMSRRREINAHMDDGITAMVTLLKNHSSEITPETVRFAFGR